MYLQRQQILLLSQFLCGLHEHIMDDLPLLVHWELQWLSRYLRVSRSLQACVCMEERSDETIVTIMVMHRTGEGVDLRGESMTQYAKWFARRTVAGSLMIDLCVTHPTPLTYPHPFDLPVSVCSCTSTFCTGWPTSDSTTDFRFSAVVVHAKLPYRYMYVKCVPSNHWWPWSQLEAR